MDGVKAECICCFCGKAASDPPDYAMEIVRNGNDKTIGGGTKASQVLWCHEACLENSLFDPNMLYIKHI